MVGLLESCVDFGLAAGVPLPEALLRARQQTGDDPVGIATAQSFVTLGA